MTLEFPSISFLVTLLLLVVQFTALFGPYFNQISPTLSSSPLASNTTAKHKHIENFKRKDVATESQLNLTEILESFESTSLFRELTNFSFLPGKIRQSEETIQQLQRKIQNVEENIGDLKHFHILGINETKASLIEMINDKTDFLENMVEEISINQQISIPSLIDVGNTFKHKLESLHSLAKAVTINVKQTANHYSSEKKSMEKQFQGRSTLLKEKLFQCNVNSLQANDLLSKAHSAIAIMQIQYAGNSSFNEDDFVDISKYDAVFDYFDMIHYHLYEINYFPLLVLAVFAVVYFRRRKKNNNTMVREGSGSYTIELFHQLDAANEEVTKAREAVRSKSREVIELKSQLLEYQNIVKSMRDEYNNSNEHEESKDINIVVTPDSRDNSFEHLDSKPLVGHIDDNHGIDLVRQNNDLLLTVDELKEELIESKLEINSKSKEITEANQLLVKVRKELSDLTEDHDLLHCKLSKAIDESENFQREAQHLIQAKSNDLDRFKSSLEAVTKEKLLCDSSLLKTEKSLETLSEEYQCLKEENAWRKQENMELVSEVERVSTILMESKESYSELQDELAVRTLESQALQTKLSQLEVQAKEQPLFQHDNTPAHEDNTGLAVVIQKLGKEAEQNKSMLEEYRYRILDQEIEIDTMNKKTIALQEVNIKLNSIIEENNKKMKSLSYTIETETVINNGLKIEIEKLQSTIDKLTASLESENSNADDNKPNQSYFDEKSGTKMNITNEGKAHSHHATDTIPKLVAATSQNQKVDAGLNSLWEKFFGFKEVELYEKNNMIETYFS